MEPKDFEALHLTNKETREIITPYAFKVHKPLLGFPLAKPWERGLAMMIDVALIFLATEVSSTLLWLFFSYGFYLSQKRGMSHRLAFLWRKPAKLIAIGMMVITSLVVFGDMVDLVSTQPESTTSIVAPKHTATSQPAEITALTKDTQQPTTSILDYGRDLIEDLGFGFGWAAAYFSLFTLLWDGQTPGKRLLGISVVNLNGKALSLMDTFGRYGGYGAGFATGLMGFFQIYWDPNRQAIQDKISNTVVVRGRFTNWASDSPIDKKSDTNEPNANLQKPS
ncbi:RDD family protein [Pseudoalteromonas xiamenensis]|uniref:RDD family protein n=1 Tax=Pseudoalteromonas xiamenensis TaxID=882626 RepID=UPI0027E51D5D|nr:RDD family protein [Pseudoalteromonas xiamenensis]WMN59683.1 RDD family protein [Pseudoalteromonas xiamenensis]